jgi:ATP-dependent Zn protease|tara:strand:- start:7116 stop:7403 length:288 start_codon:yes stop_codon:yes gene_type:complete
LQSGIARGTAGMSGAELANLVNIAAVQAAVSGETSISLERLEWAKDRIIMGVERKSAVLTEESKKVRPRAFPKSRHLRFISQLVTGVHTSRYTRR